MTSCPNCGGKVLYAGLTEIECSSLRSSCPNGAGKSVPPFAVYAGQQLIRYMDRLILTVTGYNKGINGSRLVFLGNANGRHEIAIELPRDAGRWVPFEYTNDEAMLRAWLGES